VINASNDGRGHLRDGKADSFALRGHQDAFLSELDTVFETEDTCGNSLSFNFADYTTEDCMLFFDDTSFLHAGLALALHILTSAHLHFSFS